MSVAADNDLWDLPAIIERNMASKDSQLDMCVARDVLSSMALDAQKIASGVHKFVGDMDSDEYKRKILNAVRKDESMLRLLWYAAEVRRLSDVERGFLMQCDWWMHKEGAPETTIEKALQVYMKKLTRANERARRELEKSINASLDMDDKTADAVVNFRDPTDLYCRQASMYNSFRWYGFNDQVKISGNTLSIAREHGKQAVKDFMEIKSLHQRRIVRCPQWLRRMGLRRGRAVRYPLDDAELERTVERFFPRTVTELTDPKFSEKYLYR
jgi:hypothetical protein